jgi:hypothetical protein
MTLDIEVREKRTPVVLSNEQLKYIAGTEFVPRGIRGNLPAILACVATGRELGIGDMAALKHIHIIDGSPSYSAELMTLLVRQYGHSIQGTFAPDSITVVGTRADNGDTISVTWTIEMAKRAGLAGKANWKNYPEAMLWARAVSQLCRMLFADCFAGGTHTTEELGDEDDVTAAEALAQEVFDPSLPEARERAAEADDGWDGTFPPPDDAEVPEVEKVTKKQIQRMFTIAGKAGVTNERVHQIMVEQAGVEHSADIPVAIYDHLIVTIQAEASDSLAASSFAARAAEAQANKEAQA